MVARLLDSYDIFNLLYRFCKFNKHFWAVDTLQNHFEQLHYFISILGQICSSYPHPNESFENVFYFDFSVYIQPQNVLKNVK